VEKGTKGGGGGGGGGEATSTKQEKKKKKPGHTKTDAEGRTVSIRMSPQLRRGTFIQKKGQGQLLVRRETKGNVGHH